MIIARMTEERVDLYRVVTPPSRSILVVLYPFLMVKLVTDKNEVYRAV